MIKNTHISYLIIGNGISGITAAEMLRSLDATASITIVADDPLPVYYRPALKDYLAGHMQEDRLWARSSLFYREQQIGFIPGRVMGINPSGRTVQLSNGQTLSYQMLLLAQGARPRPLSCPGANLAGVSTLRTITDYREILRHRTEQTRVVLTGSGTLALETAEVLKKHGCQVTHLLRGTTLWSDVLDPSASDLVLQEERRAGIDVRANEEVAEIIGTRDHVTAIRTTAGARIPCNFVLAAIGIEPNIDFILSTGMIHDLGIRVDKYMRTSVPGIFAAGDVVETTDARTGQARLLGQWYPSIQQARVAAYNMFQVKTSSPSQKPQLFSWTLNNYYNACFLFGLDFASAGLTMPPQGHSSRFQEITAPPRPRNYRKVLLKRGVPVGMLFLGDRTQALAFKRMIDHQVDVSMISTHLFDDNFNLDDWLDEQGVPSALLNLQPGNIGTDQGLHTPTQEVERALSREELYTQAQLIQISHPQITLSLPPFTLDQNQPVSIGRQEGTSFHIDHRSVSRNHAGIHHTNGSYILHDRGSSNGTFINNKRIPAGDSHALHHNDHIRLGDIQFRFEVSQNTFQHLNGTQLHANASRKIPQETLTTLPITPTLVLLGPRMQPATIPLETNACFSIGRDPSNTIPLTDPATSQMHAEIFSTSEGFYIRDLNSRNGVFVNQSRINNPYHLDHGDSIVIGNILVYFSHPQTFTPPELPVLSGPLSNPNPEETKNLPVTGLSHRPAMQPLTPDRVAFEIDMCIGCDRCMVACPLPISSTITIADLNQSTIQEKITPQVARFTHACIMCGSCVPVCPVDNHRDLLVLSLKQRLGSSWEDPIDERQILAMLPSTWTVERLLKNLRMQLSLQDSHLVPDTYLFHLITASRLRTFEKNETVIREGEYGRDLYFIIDGRLALVATAQDQAPFPIAILRPGEHFGEDGMLTGQPYNTTAQVQYQPVTVLQVPEQVMQHLMELVPEVRTFFDSINNVRSLRSILKRMSLFQDVSNANIDILIKQAHVKQYERNEVIFSEHDGTPDRETLHIILEGFVKVARTLKTRQGKTAERIIAYRQSGDYFIGGLDLLGDGKGVSVSTINRVRVAEISRQTMQSLLKHYPTANKRFTDRMREYTKTANITRSSIPVPSLQQSLIGAAPLLPVETGLQSLVGNGVVEGNEVLIIDLDKCIHCDECEDACERRHGHSRMNRKGKVIGNVSITTTCRQCQDPVCMLCSRAGIARHPNGEVYITESCIGCGICAERCPYGAISIVDADGETNRKYATDSASDDPAWLRFNNFFTHGNAKKRTGHWLPVIQGTQLAPGPLETATYDATQTLRKKIAIKCDLCAGYNNQACVQACPTGAAIRVQPTAFFGSTEEILNK